MTNPIQHGQVPEALIDLIDAYAEARHRCGGIYNPKTEAARKAVIEALSGVQALSAAPAEQQAAPKAAPGEPSDAEIDAFLDSPAGITWVLAANRERYHLLVRAVLAKWGSPQPVVREPLTDAQIAEMMRDTWGCASIAPRHALEFARAVERAHGIPQKGCD